MSIIQMKHESPSPTGLPVDDISETLGPKPPSSQYTATEAAQTEFPAESLVPPPPVDGHDGGTDSIASCDPEPSSPVGAPAVIDEAHVATDPPPLPELDKPPNSQAPGWVHLEEGKKGGQLLELGETPYRRQGREKKVIVRSVQGGGGVSPHNGITMHGNNVTLMTGDGDSQTVVTIFEAIHFALHNKPKIFTWLHDHGYKQPRTMCNGSRVKIEGDDREFTVLGVLFLDERQTTLQPTKGRRPLSERVRFLIVGPQGKAFKRSVAAKELIPPKEFSQARDEPALEVFFEGFWKKDKVYMPKDCDIVALPAQSTKRKNPPDGLQMSPANEKRSRGAPDRFRPDEVYASDPSSQSTSTKKRGKRQTKTAPSNVSAKLPTVRAGKSKRGKESKSVDGGAVGKRIPQEVPRDSPPQLQVGGGRATETYSIVVPHKDGHGASDSTTASALDHIQTVALSSFAAIAAVVNASRP
eukprot:m.239473 g.239473  ORF g.239473 m.239473 type:complete len:469 (-) comp26257_c2_seq18:116-1522(-)